LQNKLISIKYLFPKAESSLKQNLESAGKPQNTTNMAENEQNA